MQQSDWDVVVVGAGPAGFSLTQTLLLAGKSVLVVSGNNSAAPSGPIREETTMQSSGPWGHEELNRYTHNGLGGAGNQWGGRSVLFDPIDFERRSWIPNSGWPISYSDYLSAYPSAASILGLPSEQNLRMITSPGIVKSEPDASESLSHESFEFWSPETNFAKKWSKLAREHRRLRILGGVRAVRIVNANLNSIKKILCSDGSESFSVTGKFFVLATGALENARLMLVSGFGDGLPALGRYYMSHTWFTSLQYDGGRHGKGYGFRSIAGVQYRQRWRVTDQFQRSNEIANAVAFPVRTGLSAVSMHDSKNNRAIERNSKHVFSELLSGLNYVSKTLQLRRPPLRLPGSKLGPWSLWFQGEHCPVASSRVFLLGERLSILDSGLGVNIDFSDIDFKTAEEMHAQVSELLLAGGFQLKPSHQISVDGFRAFLRGRFNSNAHHFGTTRMGIRPDRSVVNADCQVHGLENLFVAGSSVFPTSSHANPTLSIVMMAVRLANKILARL